MNYSKLLLYYLYNIKLLKIMQYISQYGNYMTIEDSYVKRIITSPFHQFVLILQDGNRIYTNKIKA